MDKGREERPNSIASLPSCDFGFIINARNLFRVFEMMETDIWKTKLLALKDETMQSIAMSKGAAAPVALDQTLVGRVSRMDAMQQQEMALAAQRRREAMIMQIDQALGRIEAGDFGYCVICDEEIAETRLNFNPVVLTCVSCAK